MITDGLTKVGQGAAEVGAGGGFRVTGPQKTGQLLTAVCLVRLDCEIGQQRTSLVGPEIGRDLAIQGDLRGAEQPDLQRGHRTTFCGWTFLDYSQDIIHGVSAGFNLVKPILEK